ncbi:hypothetical protein [Actinomadura atramentaria]|uniref:hypothetical protein n=1 Tax=Actinomadura atramentaria TaxID=1990 RepID=UPI0012F98E57|nr:hypothetical protein [Actinomadura atramentaria]
MRGTKKTALSTAVLVTASILATAASGVAGTWKFLPGGTIHATEAYTLYVMENQTGIVVTCDTVTSSSTAHAGSGLSGDDLLSIDSISFADSSRSVGCPASAGSTAQLTPLHLPWKYQASSYDAGSGKVEGRITGISLRVTNLSDGCVADIGFPGGIPVTYENSTGTVVPAADTGAVIESTNCDRTIANVGDTFTVDGAFMVNPVQTVTSP